MEELVSIVVPVYNVEEYLNECVKSLVNQTYTNLEIILVDDGSTDSSPDLCEQWAKKDKRIRVIHKRNAGAGMARNTGMDNAHGKYMFFIDSDDYIDITTVEKCVQSAQGSNSDVVLFGRNNVFHDGRIVSDRISAPCLTFSGDALRTELLPGMFTYKYGYGITSAGRMHNLNVLKQNGLRFDSEREIVSEDSFFSLELFSKIETVTLVPECLYYYRKRSNSISRRYQEDRQTINDNFVQKSVQLCEELGYPIKVVWAVQARYLMYSLAHMKQIVGSHVSYRGKYRALRTVFNDTVLRQILTDDVLVLCKRSSRIFWKLFIRGYFHICGFLLWYKSHR